MTEVERAIAEGWRYLKLKPAEVLSLTPREFTILMRAETESRHDDYERMTTEAMFVRQAYHAKKLKPSDLFKRPDGSKRDKRMTREELREYTEQQQAVLAQFSFAKK